MSGAADAGRPARPRAGASACGCARARIIRSSMPSRRPRSATTTLRRPARAGGSRRRWRSPAARNRPAPARRRVPRHAARAPSSRSRASAAVRRLGGQHDAVDLRPRVARQVERDAGQRRHGAGGAEQAHAAVADLMADAVHRLERPQPVQHVARPSRRKSSRSKRAAAEPLGQRDHADRQRDRSRSARGGRRPAAGAPRPVRSSRRRCRTAARAGRCRAAAARSSRAPVRPPRGWRSRRSRSPVSPRTRCRNSRPLTARRHASVAMARSPRTGRRSAAAAQACRADDRALHRAVG